MQKTIKRDRAGGDYAMYLDGRLVGYASSYREAEARLDEMVHSILSH